MRILPAHLSPLPIDHPASVPLSCSHPIQEPDRVDSRYTGQDDPLTCQWRCSDSGPAGAATLRHRLQPACSADVMT